MNQSFNTRVLIIDDDEAVRDSFRDILNPHLKDRAELNALAEAEADLFDEEPIRKPEHSTIFDFDLQEARTGKEGYERVKKSLETDTPFAVIFVDMRMPGWDGLETVQQIRSLDKRAEVVFVTAYSDHSISEIVRHAGKNVSYHCKPFSLEEIQQIATKAVYEWNKARNLEDLIQVVAELRGHKWQLHSLLNNVLGQVSDILGCTSALVARREDNVYKAVASIGLLADEKTAGACLDQIEVLPDEEMYVDGNMVYFHMDKYGVLALFDGADQQISTEKIYFVRLFLEQVNAAVQNMDLQDALIRQEKMSAVGQAVSMLSHDLRSPIGNIILLAELAAEEYEDEAQAKEYLENIRQVAEDGLMMVTDVLDFIQNRGITTKPVEVGVLLKQIKMHVDGLLKDHQVSMEYSCTLADSFLLDVDASKINRVIVNLIGNAVQALEGGSVPDPKIELLVEQAGDTVSIRVQDNGPGIPVQVRERLFVPFATYGKTGGTGLGLAIVKQFVEAHGGIVTVETSEQGTTFSITLPCKEAGETA